jgi:hypothetical protein
VTRPYDSIELIDTQIAAAKRSVNRLKRFDRSAKEHLEQHQRWLEGYVAQETRDRERHERRLRHLQLRHQRRIRRRRLIQWCKQLALAVALFVRSSGLSVLKGVVSALTYLAELLLISASWLGAKVYALARLLIKLLAVSFSWVRSKAYASARSTAKLLSIGLSWSRVKANAFALSLVGAASASFAWVQGKSHDLARSTARLLSSGLSWSWVKARRVVRFLVDAASASFAWVQGKSHDLARSTARLLWVGLSWSRVKARTVALSIVDAASVSFAWVKHKAYALARSTAKLLSIGLSWSCVKARACKLLLLNLASVSHSWIVTRAGDLASSCPKLVSATRLQARRYRRRSLALAGTLPERTRVGIQGFHRSTEPMKLALKRRLVGSSTSDSGPSADEEGSSLIPKRNDHIEPEPQHAPFQHQEPAQEHSAILAPIENEIIAGKSLTGGASSTGPIDTPQNATDIMAALVAGAPVTGMDVPTAGNESPVKARSRKRRRHRKRRRRHGSHDVPFDSYTG